MLIGIGYRKGAGKDTVGAMLVKHYGFDRLAFADPLKEAARTIFGFSQEQLHGTVAQKETRDPFWGFSPRHALQQLGTEVARNIHPQVWVKAVERQVRANPSKHFVITDMRFKNELTAVHNMGGRSLRITRPGLPGGDLHASELELEGAAFDHTIVNDDTLEMLEANVHAWMASLRCLRTC